MARLVQTHAHAHMSLDDLILRLSCVDRTERNKMERHREREKALKEAKEQRKKERQLNRVRSRSHLLAWCASAQLSAFVHTHICVVCMCVRACAWSFVRVRVCMYATLQNEIHS